MNRVVHFEFGVEDPERASKFYSKVFSWKIEKWEGPEDYWLVTTGLKDQPGIDGGLMRHKDGTPRCINTIAVSSVDEYCKRVTKSGGKVVVPKMAIPGVGYQAYCEDTEGNLFGIHQQDPKAK
ncbi:MAG: VOC family protein [Deinococcus sp.]|nr:VOC family protein [Deinococcus sp.]